MKTKLLCVVLLAATPAFGETPKESFDGTWAAVEGLNDGRPFRESELSGVRLKFAGSKLTKIETVVLTGEEGKTTTKTREYASTIKINETTSPKTIDIIAEDGERVLGIYKFEEGKLTICARGGEGPRPTEFDSTKNSKISLLVLKKVRK